MNARRAWAFTALAFLSWAAPARAQVPPGTYGVETLPGPAGIAPEASALTYGPDGRLYVAFRRGTVQVLDPVTGRWSRFASGLHTPLGILPGKPGELIVAQLPELTRVVDTDGDGAADLYETLHDGWGMSGNYHEFLGGPVRDERGRYYVSLGLASGAANPRTPVRGGPLAPARQAPVERPGHVNRVSHYSPVPLRGCVVEVVPGKPLVPISCGLRQPNGLVRAPDGTLFVADNQGDWVGTSPLHHVSPGAFHGHPASLRWDPTWTGGDPLEASVDELEARRKPPALLFPQNDMAGSVAQGLFDVSQGAFGPYAGQIIFAEWTYPRLLRAQLERVDGVFQGAAFILLEGQGLRTANHRLAFSPDGRSLAIAQTSRIWGAVEGLQRVTWTGQVPMDILRMELTPRGFDLVFTKPVDPASAQAAAAWSMTRYRYAYHAQYGSPKVDVESVRTSVAALSPDGRRLSLHVKPLTTGRAYELRPSGVRGTDGQPLCTRLAVYTVNRLKKETP